MENEIDKYKFKYFYYYTNIMSRDIHLIPFSKRYIHDMKVKDLGGILFSQREIPVFDGSLNIKDNIFSVAQKEKVIEKYECKFVQLE